MKLSPFQGIVDQSILTNKLLGTMNTNMANFISEIRNVSSAPIREINQEIEKTPQKIGMAEQDILNLAEKLKEAEAQCRAFGDTSKANKLKEMLKTINIETTDVKGSMNELRQYIEKTFGTNALKQFDKELKNIDKTTNKVGKKSNFGSNLKTALGIGTVALGIRKTYSFLKEATTESIDFVETQNLFNVSMGKTVDQYGNLDREASKYYTKAMAFQEKLSNKLKINIEESMEYQALFNAMSKSMGIGDEPSYKISENFTKLGYDLSSLYNIDPENAMQKLRAGLSGQTKPLRDLGLDITQQSLEPLLDELGIERSTKQLSQAEKMIARYIVVLRQASLAHGDFAKTMDSPANQLRIFNAQLTAFKRNMGNLWQGLLGNILPYINAIMMVINELLKMVAKLFGFKVSDQNVNISAGIGADDLADDLGTASGKAKELKKQLMGFDEINNITLPDKTSGGSGASVGGIDQKLLDAMKEYDNMMDKVKSKATDIRDKIMRWLGFTQELNSETGELEWKLRKDIYPNILKIRDGAIAVATALLGWKVSKIAKNILGLVGNFGTAEKSASGLLGIVSKLASKLGLESGSLTAGFGAAAGGALLLGGYFAYNYTQSSNFRQGIETVKDCLISLTDYICDSAKKQLIEFKNILSNLVPRPIKNAIDGLKDTFKTLKEELQITNVDLALANVPYVGIIGKINIALKTLGYINKPIVESFELLNKEMIETGEISQETANKLNPMLSGFENIDNKLKTLNYSKMVPSQKDVDSIKNNMTTIVKTIGSEIETNKQNAIKSINQLFSNSGITDKEKQKMLKSVENMYEEQNAKIKELEKQTNEILENAKDERRPLREDEVRIVAENQEKMKKITIKEMSATEQEFKNIQTRITATAKEQSTLQASEIIKQAIKTRNDTKTEAEQRYQEQIEIANQLRERGTEEAVKMADKIIEEAERQKEETNKSADESFANLISTYKEKNPEILKLVDTNTGEIKSRWDILKENISTSWNNAFENIKEITQKMKAEVSKKFDEIKNKISDWYENKIKPLFSWEKWQQLGKNSVMGIEKGINANKELINKALTGVANGAVKAFNIALGIRSPSRVMAKQAKFIPEGIAKGIDDNINTVYNSMKELSQGIMVNPNDFEIDTNQFIDYGQISGAIATQSNIKVDSNIESRIENAIYRGLSNATIPIEIEATTDEGIIFKKVQVKAKEFYTQTGEPAFEF